jgi:hypothetical protein
MSAEQTLEERVEALEARVDPQELLGELAGRIQSLESRAPEDHLASNSLSMNADGEIESSGGTLPPSVEKSLAVVVEAEYEPTHAGETVFANATKAPFTVPLPAASAGNKGWRYTVVNTSTNANLVTVKPRGGEILGPGLASKEVQIGEGQTYNTLTFTSDGTNYHVT